MDKRTLTSDLLLLLAAAIWGFAFVAQRVGMQHMGPFLFNAIRFALGALVIVPLIRFLPDKSHHSVHFPGAILMGVVLFAGSSLQQVGIVYTTAGKAGFITGLYVVLVPFYGLFLRHRIRRANWLGAFLAVIGLYLLSIRGALVIQKGDFLVLLSALFWAVHVHLIGWLSPTGNARLLSIIQYAVCSLLSFIVALFFEPIVFEQIFKAAIPIIYGGVFSVGIAYSLQITAQKQTPPSHAAILLSLEAVFAVFGGWLILSEGLSLRSGIGCLFMLMGMVVSQLGRGIKRR